MKFQKVVFLKKLQILDYFLPLVNNDNDSNLSTNNETNIEIDDVQHSIDIEIEPEINREEREPWVEPIPFYLNLGNLFMNSLRL